MAASLIEFESSRKKAVERHEKRKAREEVLAKAEASFERRKAFDEARKQRGEDKWMLPSVNARLKEEELANKGKKAKKKKKHKKEKKQKKKFQTSSPDSSEPEWVEAGSGSSGVKSIAPRPPAVEKKPEETTSRVQRDDWMLLESSFGPTYSRKDLKESKESEKEKEEKRLQLDRPGQHTRELNPYWKDGGSGLPPPKPEKSVATSESKPATGDGGLTWLQRAYQRAVEQAKEEGRSLEEIAAERWGSLEKLEKLLAAAARKSSRGCDSDGSRRRRSPPMDRGHRRMDRYTSDRYTRMDAPTSHKKASDQFFRPTDNDGDARLNEQAIRQHSRQREPDSRARIPAWKNKEFIQEREKTPVSSDSSSQSSDEETVETIESAPPPQMMTDDEMNALSAKILKAELLGNETEAALLKSQLESARQLRQFGVGGSESSEKDGRSKNQEEVVILSRTDYRGMTRPLSVPEGLAPKSGGRRKKQKVETHNATGARTRYFADDDKYSLKQMFEREKLSTAEESNEMFARLAGKGVQRSGPDFDMDEILVDRASQKESDAKVEERQRAHAIHEHKRMNESMDSCFFCFGNPTLPKHLIAAIATKVYLCLPQHKSLTEGHCLLVPMRHISAGTQLDEDVWEEMQNFKKALTKMFESQDQDVVFFESSMHLRRFPHMVLHCVPMPRDVGDTAPIYFKKAILESETEWSHNKKLVDLSNKDVRRAVPKGLPYFAVTFGLDGGFAHVIEDEQLFPRNFAQEIIGGILDLEPNVWRKPSRENFDQQRKKVLKFSEWWKPYDWTSTESE